jgi:hypothetical protein
VAKADMVILSGKGTSIRRTCTIWRQIMNGGYESMVWIRDKNGREYACYLDDIKGKIKTGEELTAAERAKCLEVNEIVGTERW